MKTLTEIGISVAVMGFVCSVMHIDLALLLPDGNTVLAVSDGVTGHEALDVAIVLHGDLVVAQDHVALLEARLGGGAAALRTGAGPPAPALAALGGGGAPPANRYAIAVPGVLASSLSVGLRSTN